MNEELKKLLAWFDNYEITFNEIRLSQCQYIFDLRKFISVQTNSVRRNWNNPTFEYDILSLYQLKKVLEVKEEENTPYTRPHRPYKTRKHNDISNKKGWKDNTGMEY